MKTLQYYLAGNSKRKFFYVSVQKYVLHFGDEILHSIPKRNYLVIKKTMQSRMVFAPYDGKVRSSSTDQVWFELLPDFALASSPTWIATRLWSRPANTSARAFDFTTSEAKCSLSAYRSPPSSFSRPTAISDMDGIQLRWVTLTGVSKIDSIGIQIVESWQG